MAEPVGTTYLRPAGVGLVVDPASQEERYAVSGGALYLAPLPDGPVVVVSGVAVDLYLAVVEQPAPDLAELRRRLATRVGVGAEEVDDEGVTELLDWFLAEGLLVVG